MSSYYFHHLEKINIKISILQIGKVADVLDFTLQIQQHNSIESTVVLKNEV